MDYLPVEILSQILQEFSHIATKNEVLRARGVCWSWRNNLEPGSTINILLAGQNSSNVLNSLRLENLKARKSPVKGIYVDGRLAQDQGKQLLVSVATVL